MKQIILASTSPRRKQILEDMGIEFTIVPARYEEIHGNHSDPYELVQEFAYEKAKEVLTKYPDAIVIGSDTIVVDPEGQLLPKPKDRSDAFDMMRRLQGNKSLVVSAVAVLAGQERLIGHDTVEVVFKPMNDEQINTYLDDPAADWHDKAGAYAAQGKAGEWIVELKGEWTTTLGLPRPLLEEYLGRVVQESKSTYI